MVIEGKTGRQGALHPRSSTVTPARPQVHFRPSGTELGLWQLLCSSPGVRLLCQRSFHWGLGPQSARLEGAAILRLASEQDGEIHQVQLGEQLLPALFS